MSGQLLVIVACEARMPANRDGAEIVEMVPAVQGTDVRAMDGSMDRRTHQEKSTVSMRTSCVLARVSVARVDPRSCPHRSTQKVSSGEDAADDRRTTATTTQE
jgi:hypothetical protein